MARPETILIVEDSLTQRTQLERMLRRHGFRVFAARDGAEGLSLLRTERPALVVSDIQMPSVSGYDLCRQIKQQPAFQHTPVILLTSLSAPPDIIQGLACGADNFVVKPYEETLLLRRIEALLTPAPPEEKGSAVHVEFEGEEYTVLATRRQILNLLLPTYETALQNQRQLRQTHEQLKAAQAALIQAEKLQSVGRLAAGVAHEVRNPLAIAEMGLAYLETLRLPEEAGEILTQTREALARANGVVTSLMDSSVRRRLGVRAADLAALVEHALAALEAEVSARGVEVGRDFHAGLPPLHLDEAKLEQALHNVLLNALQAMPEGGVLTLRTGLRRVAAAEVGFNPGDRSGHHFREGEQVAWLEIANTGPAITPEHLEKIFDPFFSTRPTGEALGLGLTVARKLIELHGGTTEVRNRPEGGVSVLLTLPLP